MSNQWLRLWHDMPNDPKFRTVARISKQRIGDVQAVYLHLLVSASQHVTRGHASVTVEDLASALDMLDEDVQSICTAMQGRMLDGARLTGWEKRQPKREDAGDEASGAKSAAERKREERARKRAEAGNVTNVTTVTGNVTCHEKGAKGHESAGNGHDASVTQDAQNAAESALQGDTPSAQVIDLKGKDFLVTPCHAESRNVTLDKDTEKDTEKENTHTAAADQGAGEPGGSVCVSICNAMREAGIADTDSASAKLAVLVGKGANVGMFVAAAAVALGQTPPKGFDYALGVVVKKMMDAAKLAGTGMAVPAARPAVVDVARTTVPTNPNADAELLRLTADSEKRTKRPDFVKKYREQLRTGEAGAVAEAVAEAVA